MRPLLSISLVWPELLNPLTLSIVAWSKELDWLVVLVLSLAVFMASFKKYMADIIPIDVNTKNIIKWNLPKNVTIGSADMLFGCLLTINLNSFL